MNEQVDGIPQQTEKIELFAWDSNGPELENNVASFTIKDPAREKATTNEYCIGYKFLGGDLKEPANWEYDHTNYWNYDDAPRNDDGEIDPVLVSKEKLDELLEAHDTSRDILLALYCVRLNGIK